jgi:hypothetical protein
MLPGGYLVDKPANRLLKLIGAQPQNNMATLWQLIIELLAHRLRKLIGHRYRWQLFNLFLEN